MSPLTLPSVLSRKVRASPKGRFQSGSGLGFGSVCGLPKSRFGEPPVTCTSIATLGGDKGVVTAWRGARLHLLPPPPQRHTQLSHSGGILHVSQGAVQDVLGDTVQVLKERPGPDREPVPPYPGLARLSKDPLGLRVGRDAALHLAPELLCELLDGTLRALERGFRAFLEEGLARWERDREVPVLQESLLSLLLG